MMTRSWRRFAQGFRAEVHPGMSATAGPMTGRGRPPWAAAVLLGTGLLLAPAASADGLDCTGDLGDPVGGTPEWDAADLNNRECAQAGLQQLVLGNPAVAAARAANAAAGQPLFLGDPFREPQRWGGQRGSYQVTSYTDGDGNTWSAALFGPLDPDGGPYPGVLIVCHICPIAAIIPGGGFFPHVEVLSSWYWAAQALAEAGYVVMYSENAGNSPSTAVAATDFFVATPEAPSPAGEVNPWHARLDRSRLGIAGHSGAAGVAITVGHSDPRFDAIVAWDPAGSFTMEGVTPRIPTMIQVADYRQETVPPPRPEKPTPALPKFFFFDTISAAGIDAMQVGLRASMHFEWSRFPEDPTRPHSIYGEMVALYYTLAWFDRYLAPSRVPGMPLPAGLPEEARSALSDRVAKDALRRLTASDGDQRFDHSADMYSIGVGFFDPKEADKAGDVEAGNVPVRIFNIPVRNLLSLQYDSRYFLEGGALQCADMRTGCWP